jgi:two-component system nitrate/nitrite sensor histidine kinase NarX
MTQPAVALREQAHVLNERAKELNCLYGISALLEKPGISLAEILAGIVALIPPAWQYPEVTGARITLEDEVFKAGNFQETAWRQAQDIVVHGIRTGTVEVCYREKRPASDEGPFLKEERWLLSAIAERLGRMIERVRAEEALRESEARWRSITECSPDYIMWLDRDARIQFINRTIPGLTREEVIGTSFYGYALEEYREVAQGCFERVLTSGQPDSFDSVYKRLDGTIQYFESYVGPVWRGDEIIGLTVSSRDVTARKQAEVTEALHREALRASEEKLKALFNVLPIGISILDENRNVVDVNPALEAIQTLSREQLMSGAHVRRAYLRADGTPMPMEEFPSVRAFKEHRSVQGTEIGIVKEDGAITWVSVGAAPLPLPGLGVAVTTLDITERKQAEEARLASETRYRRLFEAARDGILILDADTGQITDVNPFLADLLGHAREFFLGEKLWEIGPFKDVAAQKAAFMELQSAGYIRYEDLPLEASDGRRMDVEFVSNTYLVNGKKVIQCNIRDITERKRAEEALQQRTHDLELLNGLGRGLGETLDLPQVLDRVSRAVREVITAAGGSVWLWDEDLPGWLVCQAAYPLDPAGPMSNLRLPPGEGITGWVAQHGESVVASYAPADPRYSPRLGAQIGFQTHSLLAVPLRARDAIIGVLTAVNKSRGDFDTHDRLLLETLAAAAAIAIENARLYDRAQRMAAATERIRLARDLHDAVTQTLFSASLIADVLPRLWERNQDEGRQRLEELRVLTRGALAEMRTLLLELRPTALLDTELGKLLQQLAEGISSRTRTPIVVTAEGLCSLPPDVHMTLYHITQEALNNVAKHAEADQVTVSLRCTPAGSPSPARDRTRDVWLRIRDDGRGFDPSEVPAGHLGLGIMRERAESIGAMFQIESQIGHGTQIEVTWSDPQFASQKEEQL